MKRQQACFTCGYEESTDGTSATCRRCLTARAASLEKSFDQLTLQYFNARQSLIAEFSGDTNGEWEALLREVNGWRAQFSLPAIERPDHWPDDSLQTL